LLPNVVAICERDDGSVWLVDAGLSAQACAAPVSVLGRARVLSLGVRLVEADAIASQMQRAGLDPGRVTTIVATHLHFDHIGGVVDFPNAEVIAVRGAWEAARAARRFGGYRQQDLDMLGRLRLVELQPKSVLGAHRSLALDAELTLVDTPGHAAGHVAVLVTQDQTRWLHGGDCAYQEAELLAGRVSPLARALAHDMDALRRSRDWLRSLHAEARVRLVLSHDDGLYRRLPQLHGR
jgi:glyoxylase-like metal-dependent hydrolase (beta-lactamase superfamily II)